MDLTWWENNRAGLQPEGGSMETVSTVLAGEVKPVMVEAARNTLVAALSRYAAASADEAQDLVGAIKVALAHLGVHVVEETE